MGLELRRCGRGRRGSRESWEREGMETLAGRPRAVSRSSHSKSSHHHHFLFPLPPTFSIPTRSHVSDSRLENADHSSAVLCGSRESCTSRCCSAESALQC